MKEFKVFYGLTVIVRKGKAKQKFHTRYQCTPAMCTRLRQLLKEIVDKSYGIIVIGRNEDFKPLEHDNIICDNIIHLIKSVKECVLYKEVEKESWKIIEVPITYALPLDHTIFNVVTGTFNSSGFSFADIKSGNEAIQCDIHVLKHLLEDEGFDVGISTTNCIFLRSGDIELDDEGKLIFTAITKAGVITTEKVKVKA